MNLRLYLFVSDVIEKNEGRSEFKISLYYCRGLGASPQSFREPVDVFSVCGVFVDD